MRSTRTWSSLAVSLFEGVLMILFAEFANKFFSRKYCPITNVFQKISQNAISLVTWKSFFYFFVLIVTFTIFFLFSLSFSNFFNFLHLNHPTLSPSNFVSMSLSLNWRKQCSWYMTYTQKFSFVTTERRTEIYICNISPVH